MKFQLLSSLQPQRYRYHIQIYVSFLLVLFVFLVLFGLLISSYIDKLLVEFAPKLNPLVERVLSTTHSPAELEAALRELTAVCDGPVALFASNGQAIASSDGISDVLLQYFKERDPRFTSVLPDGRVVVFDWHTELDYPLLFLGLFSMAALAALGTWPLVRYLTKRLDTLRQHADALTQGNFSARIEARGNDEITQIGYRFNQAAERIESLVNSQRAMLAAASHELRSPLARIRMATSLIGDERPELQSQIAKDIAELDSLIGDLLFASRLSSATPQLKKEQIDLLGLAAEETSRVGAELSGESISIQGDRHLIKHMVRNLLENSRRHAAGSVVGLEITSDHESVLIHVLDRGPGIPPNEREKIFEPFYRLQGQAESGEGSGYGLALVRQITRLHGGDVICLAREGGGAHFQISLPKN